MLPSLAALGPVEGQRKRIGDLLEIVRLRVVMVDADQAPEVLAVPVQ